MDINITIKLKDREITLSQDEARDMYDKLCELFHESNFKEYIPIYYPSYPSYPYPYWWGQPTVTCNNT